MRRGLTAFLVATVLGLPLSADDAPTLTELQKTRLEARILAVELAQARLDALIKDLTVPGYDLTREGTYVKKPVTP